MSTRTRIEPFWGAILIFLGAILFSTKAIMVKLAYEYEVEATVLLTLRMLFSVPFYLIIGLTAKQTTGLSRIKGRDYLLIAVVGLLGHYIASLADFIGLQYVTASIERLVLYVYPTIVLLMSWIFLKKKISRIQWLALVIAYIGIAVVLGGDVSVEDQSDLWMGVFWVFMAALFYSAYLVGSGELVVKFGTRRFTAFSMLSAAIGVFIHSFIQIGGQWPDLHPAVYGYGLLMAVVATVIPSFMIQEGIRRVGANSAGIIGSIGPVSTIILAYIFLGERMTEIQILGTAIVMGGILLITLNKNK
ncbi:MAG: DMT family transporter [Bacteroidota bacterium]